MRTCCTKCGSNKPQRLPYFRKAGPTDGNWTQTSIASKGANTIVFSAFETRHMVRIDQIAAVASDKAAFGQTLFSE